MATLEQAKKAKEKAKMLFTKNVTGIGLTKKDGEHAVYVMLEKPIAILNALAAINGVPIVYEVTGKLTKQSLKAPRA